MNGRGISPPEQETRLLEKAVSAWDFVLTKDFGVADRSRVVASVPWGSYSIRSKRSAGFSAIQ
jgi:hypothetical protein